MEKELTIREKRKYLKSHGWFQNWGKDDWLSIQRYENDDYTNPDKQGLSTEEAYKIEMELKTSDPEEKVWGGKETTYQRLKKKATEIRKKRGLKT